MLCEELHCMAWQHRIAGADVAALQSKEYTASTSDKKATTMDLVDCTTIA